MRFEFNDLHELKDFIEWAGYVKAPETHKEIVELRVDAKALTDAVQEAAAELQRDLPEIESPESLQTEAARIAEQVVEPAPFEQKRKRRTKAEMEAARAAEQAGNEPGSTAGETQSEPAAANPFAQTIDGSQLTCAVEPSQPSAALADMEAAEFIKARLGERPEVSQVEHLNMARTFIGKHGMDKYNQSFALTGLTNNVMGYSPADCAAHAAALDFLSLE